MTWWPVESSSEEGSKSEFTFCPICDVSLFLWGRWFENRKADCENCSIKLHEIGGEEFDFFLKGEKISLEELLRMKKLRSFQ